MNDEQTPDVDELERALCSLPDVDAVRVVVDHKGRPVEVHVVAAPEKLAKQISRDVHSYALASLGVDLDRRIISVVNRAPVTDGASDEIGQSAQDRERPSALDRGHRGADGRGAHHDPRHGHPR